MVNKLTKIVATISDRRCSESHIRELYEAGINVVRLNTAHQSPEDTLKVVNAVRAVSDKIALLVDTKGPEVRTKDIEDFVEITQGETIYITKKPSVKKGFCTNYDGFVDDVPVGSLILIDDGETAMEVKAKSAEALECVVKNSGKVKNKKSVNVPSVHLDLPSVTEKDRMYVKFAAEHNLDFVAHSFVRNKKDVLDIQAILDEHKSPAKIIAKIENREGVDNLDEILDVAYGVMVARGDLGIEVPAEEVPVIQKKMIQKCILRRKPVITATQMLHTMIENPRPTRAEVSDVANAIYDGTDAIMLSGETAYGDYPLESVQTMTSIAKTVEANLEKIRKNPNYEGPTPIRDYMAKAAISAVQTLPVRAMVVDTLTGRSARTVAAYRAKLPVFAKAHDARVARELSLSFGVYADYLPLPKDTNELVVKSLQSLLDSQDLKPNDLVVVLAGTPGISDGSNFLEINTVELCLKGRKI